MNKVRTHIEKVVESLVGDNIDEASVLKLTDNPSCKYLEYLKIDSMVGNKPRLL